MKDYFKVNRFDIDVRHNSKHLIDNPVLGRYVYYDQAEKAYLSFVDDAFVLLARAANRGHFLHKFNCPFYAPLLCDKANKAECGICSKEKPWSRDSIKVNFACFIKLRDEYTKKSAAKLNGNLLEGTCGFCNFEGCFQCDEGDHFILAKQYEESGKRNGPAMAITPEEINRCFDSLPTFPRAEYRQAPKAPASSDCAGCNADECLKCENHDHYMAKTPTIEDVREKIEEEKPVVASEPDEPHHELGDVAREAIDVVCGQRQDTYGNPEDSFATIAALWSAYLDVAITPAQAGVMMAFMKLARSKGQAYHRDNFRDLIGYAILCADRLFPREQK